MASMDLESRIQQVLYKMLEPSFVIEDDQLEVLLNYLTGKEDDFGGTASHRMDEHFFLPWIKRFTDEWKHSRYIIKTNVLLFTSDLMMTMCSDEDFFVKLNFTDVLLDFVALLRSVPEPQSVTRIKLKYVKLMTKLLGHKCGLQWAMANRFWFDVYTMISRTRDEELLEASCSFVVDLLEKSRDENETLCHNIFRIVMAPLNDVAEIDGCDDSVALLDGILSSFAQLEAFLDVLLRRSCASGDMRSLRYMLDKCRLDAQLERLLETSSNAHVSFELHKLIITARVIQLAIDVSEEKYRPYARLPTDKLVGSIINLMKQLGFEKFLGVIFRSYTYIKWLSMISVATNVTFDLLFQLFLYNIVPLHHYIFNIIGVRKQIFLETDDCKELFVTNMIRKVHSNTFQFAGRIMRAGLEFSAGDTILSLRNIARCSEFYNSEVANIATQLLIYHVVDIFRYLREHPEKFTDGIQEVMGAYLDTIMVMVERFDLNWKDNIEVIYVTDIASEFLGCLTLTTTAVVKGLELLNVAISKSLSPNMALLMDNASDTEILNFVQIVFDKLRDPDREVRGTAVRVVKTMCGKAKRNFDSYTNLLIDKNFPRIVFEIATTDDEAIVKVSALQCLQEMIEVEEFREELFNDDQDYDKLLHIIYLHPDESARSESVTLLKLICRSKTPAESVRARLNKATIYAALEDASLAVRTNGLEYWGEAISAELAEYGAVDGQFPEATFSRRLRKIVTFDEAQIARCLDAVLDRLAAVGCLAVFLSALRGNEEEVRCVALRLVEPFLTLVARHLPTCRTRCLGSPDSAFSDMRMGIKEEFLEYVSESCLIRCDVGSDGERGADISSVVSRILEQQNETVPRNDEISMMELTGG